MNRVKVFMRLVSLTTSQNSLINTVVEGGKATSGLLKSNGVRLVIKNSLDHVAGYCILNEFSERDRKHKHED